MHSLVYVPSTCCFVINRLEMRWIKFCQKFHEFQRSSLLGATSKLYYFRMDKSIALTKGIITEKKKTIRKYFVELNIHWKGKSETCSWIDTSLIIGIIIALVQSDLEKLETNKVLGSTVYLLQSSMRAIDFRKASYG